MNKNLKYGTYIVLGILVLVFILAVDSCRDAFQDVPLQQPTAYQQPIQYDNDVHYHNDNTAANLAAAAAVGAAAGYATNKYMDKQKQKQVSTPASVKVNSSTVPVSKRITTTSKPTFSYTTSKSSNISRSTRRK